MADVWTGIKTDWLGRRHIARCRKRMREFEKREGQLQLDLDRKKEANGPNSRLDASNKS